MIKLQRICSWCKSEITDDNIRGRQLTAAEYKAVELEATHGICRECSEKEFTKPPPHAHKFSANIKEANDGVSGGGSSKGKQLDLFASNNIVAIESNRGAGMSATIAIPTLKFCYTCFNHFKQSDMGSDPRYCNLCEAILNEEWKLMQFRSVRIKPGWVPRKGNEPHRNRKPKHNGNGIKELPIKNIKAMAADGMNSKRIAAELIKMGFSVNYRSIAKIIRGKKK